MIEKNSDTHTSTAEYIFARFVLGLEFDDLPKETVNAAKKFIADTAGVGIAGYNAPLAKELRDTTAGWGSVSKNGATVLGTADKYPLASAAFINAFQIHCQEYDCVHETAVVHPMATILGAVFSQASVLNNVSGKDIITAVTAGVEIATRLGLCVSSPLKFFRPGTAGLFGATLAVARVRQFNPSQAVSALGIALAQCSGTMQAHIEGKPTLAFQIATAARGAITSCDFVAGGFDGPQMSLTGPFGYLTLFEDEFDLEFLTHNLGMSFNIVDVSHKPFPTGRAAHGGLDCLQRAIQKGLTAENLESLTLIAPPIIKRLVGRPFKQGAAVNYVRLCFPYLASRMLLDGEVGLDSFTSDKRSDQRLDALSKNISVLEDGTTDPANFSPQLLKAVLKNGETIEIHMAAMPASAERPLSSEEQYAKFEKCLSFGLGVSTETYARNLWDIFQNLETMSFEAILKEIMNGVKA